MVAKHSQMRDTNTHSIFECIVEHGPLTKADIKKYTGLSWGSVSNITANLIDRGIIRQYKDNDASVGRIPNLLDIFVRENLLIGVDLHIAEGITVLITDLRYRILNRVNMSVTKNNRESVLQSLNTAINFAISNSEVSRSTILGIGVALQGTVDAEKGISAYSPYCEDWENVPVADILTREFSVPTVVDHDPRCMAMAEMVLGKAQNTGSLVFLRMSQGIGMSIVLDGEVYRGFNGSDAEIGHICVVADGDECVCGNKGCLELYAGAKGIINRAKLRTSSIHEDSGMDIKGTDDNIDFDDITALARSGDEFLRGLFTDAGRYLGESLSVVVNLLNPELIILGGMMVPSADLFLPETLSVMRKRVWKGSTMDVRLSSLGNNATALGAAVIAGRKLLKEGFFHPPYQIYNDLL